MHRIAILLLALTLTPYMVAADPLYKWVDAQGNVHYSDKPQPGAKKLKPPSLTTYVAPVPGAVPAPSASTAQQAQRTVYTKFEISSPQAEEVLWNVTSVTVTVSVQPGLQPGDQVTITLDDKMQGPLDSASATFDDLDRGEHTVSANLQAADGTVMVAQPVTFFIQRGTKKGH